MKRILLAWIVLTTVSVSAVWAQKTVTGTVTARDDGSPVPGVNVIVKGSTIGTVTDIEGRYQISVPDNSTVLVYSFIGLATEEVTVGTQTVIDMVMTADIRQLTEVVVTAIGLESDKASLGYSIQAVNADEIVNARETNIVNALNSKAAGVMVVSASGSPGASALIRIRGASSISRSNQPLFIVDGMPIDNSGGINAIDGVDNSNRAIDLNPNDIASLTVLKGPAATALYGIRAANGAIIVTTKRGGKGMKVEFSGAYTANQVNKLPEMQTSYAQGRPVNGVPTWRGPDTGEGFSWGPAIADLEFDGSEYDFDKNGRLVPKGTGNGQSAIGYDNYDNFFVTGSTYDANIAVSGGNEDANYYFSAGSLYQTGVVPKADFSRYTFLSKVSTKLTKSLEAGMQLNYVNSGGNRIQRGSNISGVMLGLVRNTPTFDIANGYTNGRDAANDPTTYMLPNGRQRSYRAGIYDSPLWTVNKNPFRDEVNRVIGNVNLRWDILPWLTASWKVGLDYYNNRYKSAIDINSAAVPTGRLEQESANNRDINSDFLLLINKDLGEKFNLSAVLGHNFFSTRYVSYYAVGNGFGAPGFYHISNTTTVQANEFVAEKDIFGVFGELKLAYDNFLFLNASARNDWSSALPKENNSFFYPAISLGWAFTEMLQMQSNPILSYGKLRASWGQVGNDAPLYATANYFGGATNTGDGFIDGITFPAFGVNAFERNFGLGNQNLEAELTTTIELGAEFQFLRGRLGFDVTWYSAETDGQVVAVDIAPSTGFGSAVSNIGLISNKGWEVMFNAVPVRAGDFTWDMNINFTAYENIAEKLDPNLGEGGIALEGFVSATSRVIEGQPYGVIFGDAYRKTEDGRLIIGADGWPLADTQQRILGDPNPDWFAGWRNTFSWKGLTLSALLDFRTGGDMWNGTFSVMNYWGTTQETAEQRNIRGFVFDGVVQVGQDEAGNPIFEQNATPVDFANPANGVGGTKWTRYGFGFTNDNVEDASWVRLRDVTLSYSLPGRLLDNSPITALDISLTGRNLWLKTKYKGIDPEANLTGSSNGFGLEYFGMPNTKSYGVALKVTF
jgi:TonB-linked SusC/RagA family outer membrane protein